MAKQDNTKGINVEAGVFPRSFAPPRQATDEELFREYLARRAGAKARRERRNEPINAAAEAIAAATPIPAAAFASMIRQAPRAAQAGEALVKMLGGPKQLLQLATPTRKAFRAGKELQGALAVRGGMGAQRLTQGTRRQATSKAFKGGKGLGGTRFSKFVSELKALGEKAGVARARAAKGEIPIEVFHQHQRNISERFIQSAPFTDRRALIETADRVTEIMTKAYQRAIAASTKKAG